MSPSFHGTWLLAQDLPVSPVAPTTTGDAADSRLETLVRSALRRGLMAKYFATLGADGQLRSDLQEVCGEARRQNMRVEHLIIAFKEAWRGLPESRTLPQGSQGAEFLNRVITLCIAEYYSHERAD